MGGPNRLRGATVVQAVHKDRLAAQPV